MKTSWNTPSGPGASRGFVLVSVMWVLALLTVMTIGFGHRAVLERRVAAFHVDRLQAQYMARGAAERGVVELRNKGAMDRIRGTSGRTSFDQSWHNPPDLLHDERAFSLGGEVETADEICTFYIRDEEGRISVNHAPREVLENVPGFSFRTVGAIMFRRESTGRNTMAFSSIEEVRNLPGLDEQLWEGTRDQAGLRDILTVWGSDGRININTAPREVLECIPDLRPSEIDEIVSITGADIRNPGASARDVFRGVDGIMEYMEISAERMASIRNYLKVDSSFFTVRGVATQRQGAIQAAAIAAVQTGGSGAAILDWREDSGAW